jgi:1,4-alpha-glucan branching enzyme
MARKSSKKSAELAAPPRAEAPALRRVPFIVKVDHANEVVLTGDFTNWAAQGVRLIKGSEGNWLGQIELPPGKYQYRLLVDGQWRDHPDASERVPNPFGSENCILTVA